jgi:peptidoglycan/LPS O-acetylase OafA/YrhL
MTLQARREVPQSPLTADPSGSLQSSTVGASGAAVATTTGVAQAPRPRPAGAIDERRNNFDLLRLVFAGAVLLFHQYAISREPSLEVLAQIFSAELAVQGFFVISGFLVVMSGMQTPSVRRYASKRVRRIFPAYCTVVVLCAVGGFALTSVPASEYFGGDLARYLIANLAFLNFVAPNLPGVFTGNPWTEINGALWTLKIEVTFYALVPLLLWACRRWHTGALLALLFVLSVVYTIWLDALYAATGNGLWAQLQRQLPGQLTYFLVGAALYLYRGPASKHWRALLLGAVVVLLVDLFVTHPVAGVVLQPLWVGIPVVMAARRAPYLGNSARFGDLSYGIYILHFPVIQVAIASGWYAADPWRAFVLTTTITIVLAWLSWHLVEKPFLGRQSHYRLAERAAA